MDLKGELFRFDGACKFPLAGRSESSSREADARTLRSGEKATASTSLLMAGCLGAVTFASNFFNFCYCPADCDNADKGFCQTG